MSEKHAYPLDWPQGWKRTPKDERTRAAFGVMKATYYTTRNEQTGLQEQRRGIDQRNQLTMDQATKRALQELQRMGFERDEIVISTNIELRLDGLPKGGRSAPTDPGVCVYWRKGKQTRCMAVDRYDRVADNLGAIAATLEAMRAIERHGGAAILDRAFTGFVALAAPEQPWQVLGVSPNPTEKEVLDAHRRLAMKHHPDRGGDTDQMGRINAARDEMLEVCRQRDLAARGL